MAGNISCSNNNDSVDSFTKWSFKTVERFDDELPFGKLVS